LSQKTVVFQDIPSIYFETLSVEDRLAFMLFISWWFDQRPERGMLLGSEVELK
jgi:hypothetical protein